MEKSERTKKCGNIAKLLGILHFLCLFGPFLYFLPLALALSTMGQQLFLTFEIVTCLILSLLALVSGLKTRGGLAKTIMWMFILGITICLSEVKVFIYIMSICAIVDELIIVRLKDKYKDAYAANKEIDRRQ